MPGVRRKAYLTAIGVDLWVTRADAPGRVEGQAMPAKADSHDVEIGADDGVPVPDMAAAKLAPDPQPVLLDSVAPALDQESRLDWPALQAQVAVCRRCPLCDSRTNTVFGVGNPNADLMVIGEAPGADEDRLGEPFVGRAGQLLTAMLAAIGWRREQVYIANILKCRPPGNRNPHLDEVAACRHYLQRQIELIQPRVILALGGIAAHNLLNCDEPVGRLRGRTYQYQPGDVPLSVSYHPAYLLRRPEEKAKAWDDLQRLARQLAGA